MAEHRVVDQLYFEYKNTEDAGIKKQKVNMIIHELSQHAAKEEMVVYPVIRAKLPNGEALFQRAVNEHQEVKNDLYQIDQLSNAKDQGLDALLAKVMSEVQQHVREEEGELLPLLSQSLTPAELDSLGNQFKAAAAAAPSRPHPDAPNSGVSGMMANASAKVVDAMRDLARPEVLTGKALPQPMVEAKGLSGEPANPQGDAASTQRPLP